MNTTTNFAASVQGADAAYTYHVGAIVESRQPQSVGVVVSQADAEHYGVLLYNCKEGESYFYTILHRDELSLTSVSPRIKIKLKIASMIICKPVPDNEYVIFKFKEDSYGK